MIEVLSLTKKYGKFTAVDNLSLTVRDKECYALLGLNGAGKTTLVNVLSTMIAPTGGTAKIEGYDVVKDRAEVRKIINVSPQESAVAKNLTVRENLELIAALYDLPEAKKRTEEIIERFNLTEKADVLCKKLSGGQMRRVSIALGLITQPEILFLDEPTLGLDVKARKILWDCISSLKGKMTIILTTHYLEEVEFLADRIGIITRGKMKCEGTLEEILAETKASSLEQAFLGLTEEEQ